MTFWRLLGTTNRSIVWLYKRSNLGLWSRMSSSETDSPVKYSVSKASKWKAEYSRLGTSSEEMPGIQPFSIVGSLAVFLIYFCILREENDIDEILSTSLYDRIEGLEESQLRMSLKYYRETGKDTADILKRLKELEEERGVN